MIIIIIGINNTNIGDIIRDARRCALVSASDQERAKSSSGPMSCASAAFNAAM
ncbi:MAG: hypothetical protein ACK4FG_04655 [Brevundimonas sp.]